MMGTEMAVPLGVTWQGEVDMKNAECRWHSVKEDIRSLHELTPSCRSVQVLRLLFLLMC